MFEVHVLCILRRAAVSADEAERRIAVVGHQLGPGKAGQRSEVLGHALLHLGLQRAVLRVANRIAMHQNAVSRAVAASAELRILLQAHPKRYGGGAIIGVGGWLDCLPGIGHHNAGRV